MCASLCACVQEGLRCSEQDPPSSQRQVDWKPGGFWRQSVTTVTPKEPTCTLSQSSHHQHTGTCTHTLDIHIDWWKQQLCCWTVYNTICDHRRCSEGFACLLKCSFEGHSGDETNRWSLSPHSMGKVTTTGRATERRMNEAPFSPNLPPNHRFCKIFLINNT